MKFIQRLYFLFCLSVSALSAMQNSSNYDFSKLANPLYYDTELIATKFLENKVQVIGNKSFNSYAVYTFDSSVSDIKFIKNSQILLVSTQKNGHILSVLSNGTVKVLEESQTCTLSLSGFIAKIRWSKETGIQVEYKYIE